MTTHIDEATAERLSVIAGLREFADFLEAHPSLPVSSQAFLSYVFTREELASFAGLTSWEKIYNGDAYFTLRKRFKSGAVFDLYTDRSKVCKRVVKGQRVIPPMPATEETTEDIVEWICDEPLLAAK